MQTTLTSHQESVNRAFTRQAAGYDAHDEANPILRDMRRQVYDHLQQFLKPHSSILELNAGTGIDAVHLIALGHRVHAIDISEGMIEKIREKHDLLGLEGSLTWQLLSYDRLDRVNGQKFDHVFSNFGGLNCIEDLSSVTKHLPPLLRSGAKVTLVIMPPVCPWELLSIFRGSPKAFRRFRKGGIVAHVEGEYFTTWYHSLTDIKKAFGPEFRFVRSEGVAALSPPPHRGSFPGTHPRLYSALRRVDNELKDHFPFNRWADHIIATFRYEG